MDIAKVRCRSPARNHSFSRKCPKNEKPEASNPEALILTQTILNPKTPNPEPQASPLFKKKFRPDASASMDA